MAAYKLTLTKTETGDVLVDKEIDCLIGAACAKDGNLSSLLFSDCSVVYLAAANAGARDTIKRLEAKNPIVAPLTEIVLTLTEIGKKD